jgi:hypothetical protein
MHRRIRNLHLVVGLLLTPYVLMYGASALLMAHPDWLQETQVTSRREISIGAIQGDRNVVAAAVMRQANLRGGLQSLREKAGAITFQVVRPGTSYEVEVHLARGHAVIRERRSDLGGFLKRVHHLAGWHRHVPSGVLALVLLGVSAGMVFMGVSGIYLWYKLRSERTSGWIVLALGLAYSLAALVAIRLG